MYAEKGSYVRLNSLLAFKLETIGERKAKSASNSGTSKQRVLIRLVDGSQPRNIWFCSDAAIGVLVGSYPVVWLTSFPLLSIARYALPLLVQLRLLTFRLF